MTPTAFVSRVVTADCLFAIFIGCCVATYLLLLMPSYPGFFFWDEWTLLSSLTASEELITWLTQTHMWHSIIIGKLLYLAELKIYHDDYRSFVHTNIAIHSVNCALLTYVLVQRKVGRLSTALAVIMYGIFHTHWENFMWGMQIMLFASLTCLMTTGVLLKTRSSSNRLVLGWSCVSLMLISTFCFAVGIVFPLLLSLLEIANSRRTRFTSRHTFKSLSLGMFLVIANAGFFMLASQFSSIESSHSTTIVDALKQMGFWIFMMFGTFYIPLQFVTLNSVPVTNLWFGFCAVLLVAVTILLLLLRGSNIGRGAIVFVFAGFVMYVLPGLSRWSMGTEIAFTNRYWAFGLIPSAVGLAMASSKLLERFNFLRVFYWLHFIWFCIANIDASRQVIEVRASESIWGYSSYLRLDAADRSRNAEEVFHPKTNPELTVEEARKIKSVVFSK